MSATVTGLDPVHAMLTVESDSGKMTVPMRFAEPSGGGAVEAANPNSGKIDKPNGGAQLSAHERAAATADTATRVTTALADLSGGRGGVFQEASAYVGANAGSIAEKQGVSRQDGERRALKQWADQTNRVIPASRFENRASDDGGQEHNVFFKMFGDRVGKVTLDKPQYPLDYLRRMALSDAVFGSGETLEGITSHSDSNRLAFVISQPFREGAEGNPHPAQAEIDTWMADRGFKKNDKDGSFSGHGLDVDDSTPKNWIKDSVTRKIIPIDLRVDLARPLEAASPNAGREDEGEPEHHAHTQPRASDGSFRDGKPATVFERGQTTFAKVKAAMTPGLDTLGATVQGIQSLLLPTAKSPEHLARAVEVGKHLGEMHRREESDAAKLHGDWKTFVKMGVGNEGIPLEENAGLKVMRDISQGRELTGPAKEFADRAKADDTTLRLREKYCFLPRQHGRGRDSVTRLNLRQARSHTDLPPRPCRLHSQAGLTPGAAPCLPCTQRNDRHHAMKCHRDTAQSAAIRPRARIGTTVAKRAGAMGRFSGCTKSSLARGAAREDAAAGTRSAADCAAFSLPVARRLLKNQHHARHRKHRSHQRGG